MQAARDCGIFISMHKINKDGEIRKPQASVIAAHCAFCFVVKYDLFHFYKAIPQTPTGKTHAKCYVCLRCLLQKVTSPYDSKS